MMKAAEALQIRGLTELKTRRVVLICSKGVFLWLAQLDRVYSVQVRPFFRRISINFLLFYASNKKPLNLNLIEDILYQKVYH